MKISIEFNIIILSPISDNDDNDFFIKLGIEVIKYNFESRSFSLIQTIKVFLHYYKQLKRIHPDLILTYTLKPNILGGLAARTLNIDSIATITGFGSGFQYRFTKTLLSLMYKISLKKSAFIFFQNRHNLEYFNKNIFAKDSNVLVGGSGVNLDEYTYKTYPKIDTIRFLFIGRIMKEKGIDEFLEVAKRVNKLPGKYKFEIVGPMVENYLEKLTEYESSGIIKYHGAQKNVESFYIKSHCVINPTYHEGMSNVLLEASAIGRPTIASNIPGCREIIQDKLTGFLFEPQNNDDLYQSVLKFIHHKKREEMGIAAHEKVKKEFNRNNIINVYYKALTKTIKER